MWSHAAWPGRFLPRGVPAGERLGAYARWCNAVEGNTTFYATPARETVASWARQAPPDFRFVLKLPRAITHERRLADISGPLREFLAAIEPLGRRPALWAQLPASFGPADTDALAAFLRTLPRGYRTCVEVRHPAYFTDDQTKRQLERTLTATGTEWVRFDTTVLFASPPSSAAEREARAKKPRLPRGSEALTSCPIVRYHGRDDADATIAGWQYWLDVVTGWLREGRSPTVFVHTPDNAAAPGLARRFHDEARARLPGIEPLPKPEPVGPPVLF